MSPFQSHDIEIHTYDTHFSLHIPPYFLRLDLPGPVIEDDSSSAKYDAPTGALVVSLTKLNPGDEFVGLNDMDKLLGAYKNKITSHLEEDKEEEMEISSALGGGADETREALLRERKILLEGELEAQHFAPSLLAYPSPLFCVQPKPTNGSSLRPFRLPPLPPPDLPRRPPRTPTASSPHIPPSSSTALPPPSLPNSSKWAPNPSLPPPRNASDLRNKRRTTDSTEVTTRPTSRTTRRSGRC